MWPVRRIAFFLLKFTIFATALFWSWGLIQPYYTGLITVLADAVIRLEERGERVTRLALSTSGDVIQVWSDMRTDGEPANAYEAHVLHFYVVPALAVILAFPGLRWWKRLRVFGIALGLVVFFNTVALIVTVEHTYAVILAEVARRHYSPAEQRVYTWLYEAFVFMAVQGVTAAAVVFLVAWYGPLGRKHLPAGTAPLEHIQERQARVSAGPEDLTPIFSRRVRRVGAGAALALAASTMAFGAWVHRANVRGRQSDKLWAEGFRVLPQGDRLRAEMLFLEAVQLNPLSAYALAGLGHVYLQRGDASNAARVLTEAIRLDPSPYSWHLHLADAHWMLGQKDEAEQILQDAIARWPDEQALRVRASQWLTSRAGMGATLPPQGDAAGANSEEIRLDPAAAQTHAGLGESLAQSGDFAGAARAFTEAIRWDPSVSSYHNQLGTALIRAGRQAEAEKIIRDAIERWPGEPSLHLNLSLLLYRAGRLCEAIPHLEAFLHLTPQDPAAAVVRQTLAYAQPRCPPR